MGSAPVKHPAVKVASHVRCESCGGQLCNLCGYFKSCEHCGHEISDEQDSRIRTDVGANGSQELRQPARIEYTTNPRDPLIIWPDRDEAREVAKGEQLWVRTVTYGPWLLDD